MPESSSFPATCVEVDYSGDDLRLLNEEAQAAGMALHQFLRAATQNYVATARQKRALKAQTRARSTPDSPRQIAA